MFMLMEGETVWELDSVEAVSDLLRKGAINACTWIKLVDEEANWQTIEEMLPELVTRVEDEGKNHHQ